MRSGKERHRSVHSTDPDFGGARVEIQSTLFFDLGGGIRGGNDLDADFWCAFEECELGDVLCPTGSKPSNIDSFDAASGRNRALRYGTAARKELMQENNDMRLALAMERSRGWTHEDVAMLVSLDAVRKPGELLISQDLAPANQVEGGLRGEVWELNGKRHGAKILQFLGHPNTQPT